MLKLEGRDGPTICLTLWTTGYERLGSVSKSQMSNFGLEDTSVLLKRKVGSHFLRLTFLSVDDHDRYFHSSLLPSDPSTTKKMCFVSKILLLVYDVTINS